MFRATAWILLMCVLAACGSAARPTNIAAEVGTQQITWKQLDRYVSYALNFYAWTNGTGIGTGGPRCKQQSRDSRCVRFRRQVLRRLLEEQVVAQYAMEHHMGLTKIQQQQLTRQVSDLSQNDTTTAQLLAEGRINKTFLRSILQTEALVRHVEVAVTRQKAESGDAYHLRRFHIQILSGDQRSRYYQEALDLATDGKPVPTGTKVRTEWLAPFRLDPRLKRALTVAKPGQFLGPFKIPGAYLVVKYLARGVHRYGRPARFALQTQVFHDWLDKTMKVAHAHCFHNNGVETECPRAEH